MRDDSSTSSGEEFYLHHGQLTLGLVYPKLINRKDCKQGSFNHGTPVEAKEAEQARSLNEEQGVRARRPSFAWGFAGAFAALPSGSHFWAGRTFTWHPAPAAVITESFCQGLGNWKMSPPLFFGG